MAATAVHVFGNPITQGTRAQRAQAAQNYQNADGKLDQVLQISSQSQKAATGRAPVTISSTFGRLYNATGETITKVTAHDWQGHVVGHYPVHIQNGQWAIFEHAGININIPGSLCKGSIAAVVYDIQNCTDAMIAWNNPWKTGLGGMNTAYCEMNYPGYYNNCDWEAIYTKLKASGTESHASMEGFATKVTIDKEGNTPCYTAIFSVAN